MRRRPRPLSVFWLLFPVTAAFAQAPTASPPHARNGDARVAIYRTQPGDTLTQLGRQYLVKPTDLRPIQDLNHLPNADRLPVGMALRIPRPLLRQTPATAIVARMSCASVTQNDTALPTPGALVHEGDVLRMPAECHATLLLEDGALVRLPASATLKIAVLRKNALETTPEVQLELLQGRVELNVPKRRGRAAPFEVRTPLAVMGIRGTEFRVGYSAQAQRGQLEVLEGAVNAHGANDAQSRDIAEGLGLPVDRQGRAQPVETLLAPPRVADAEPDTPATDGAPSRTRVRLHPVPQAAYTIVEHAATADLDDDASAETLHTGQWLMPTPGVQASFHRVTAVSPSGLIGQPRSYAFCTPQQSTDGPFCNVTFDAPLAQEDTPIALSFVQMDDTGRTRKAISAENLHAQGGRVRIQGLAPGHYTWRLSYDATTAGASLGPPLTLRESGAFELIALPAPAP